MFELIKKEHGGVDVCINNAGVVIAPDSILNGSTESWRTQLEVCVDNSCTGDITSEVPCGQVNVLALCICSRESVKQMRERNVDDGQIINLSRSLICVVGD